jgi:putative sporulation protein YtaF
MRMIGLIFFAIALNIDALVIAVTYGLRKITIPWLSLLILSGVSMAAISLSMLAGQALARLMSKVVAQYLGGLILIGLGVQVIMEHDRDRETSPQLKSLDFGEAEEGHFDLPLVKLPFALFKKPELVDLDHSGTIIGWEAFLLGTTLALDAAGAGLAVALQGYNIWLTALFVGSFQLLFTRWGLYWGTKLNTAGWGKWAAIGAGVVLMLFGFLKMGLWF